MSRRRYSLLLAGACALALLGATTETAEADEPTSAQAEYRLYEGRWRTERVNVFHNWEPTVCRGLGATYTDPSGDPTPPIPAAEMRAMVRSVIAQLNAALLGSLVLVDAGPGPERGHCRESEESNGSIAIGWSPLYFGTGGAAPTSFRLTDPSEGWSISGASVILSTGIATMCPNSVAQDVQLTLLHELLHAIGIDHSEEPASVMYPGTGCGMLNPTLTTDDLAALHAQYPPSDAPPPPPTPVVLPDAGRGDGNLAPPPGGVFPTAGTMPLAWAGGSIQQLSEALAGAGALSAFVTTIEGGQAVQNRFLVDGGFLNNNFNAKFAGGVPAQSVIVLFG